MSRFFLICVFLFAGFSGKAGNPMYHADSLYSAGSYMHAALEYEWINYQENNDALKAIALLKKSYCHKKLNDNAKALSTLHRINLNHLTDSLHFRILAEKALLSYLSDSNELASIYLSEINYFFNDSISDKVLYLRVLNSSANLNRAESDSLLAHYIDLNRKWIDSTDYLMIPKYPDLVNKKTAKTLSYILPGSGQAYIGYVLWGMSSLCIQGLLGLYAVASIRSGFYLTGFFTATGSLRIFYSGGAKYAEHLAEKKNFSRINSYNQNIKDFILKTENKKITN